MPPPSSTSLSAWASGAADGTPAGSRGGGIRHRPVRSPQYRGPRGRLVRLLEAAVALTCRSATWTYWARAGATRSCGDGTTPRMQSQPRPRAVRRPGCPTPRPLRWCSGAEPPYGQLDARQPAGASSAWDRGGPRDRGGSLPGALARDGGRAARHPQAGGAYLPLDPDYPAERLAFMLEDAGAGVLVTQSGLTGGSPPTAPAWSASMPTPPDRTPARHRPGPLAHPHNPAYVIYTSGSTGTQRRHRHAWGACSMRRLGGTGISAWPWFLRASPHTAGVR
jgi:hypothetical protein